MTAQANSRVGISVDDLKKVNWNGLTLHEKVEVRERGRSTPDLNMSWRGSAGRGRTFTRTFNSSTYQDWHWLTGCEISNALFCFPCLLLGGHDTWTKTGLQSKSLGKLLEKLNKHDKSISHIENLVSLRMLGVTNIKKSISVAERNRLVLENEQIKKNRHILSAIVDAIFHCGTFETGLRGHDESEDSDNPGIFRGMLNYGAKLDPALAFHLETSTVFRGTSKRIQNEILDCLLHVYREHVISEIKTASFVAVMADETTDVAQCLQLVIVLRYVHNGDVKERFWGFFNPESANAESIASIILEQLRTVIGDNTTKLIAQTFDGANVMRGEKGGVQAKLRAVYKYAYFLHCYAHQLNLIMSNSCAITRSTRIFFANLSGIPTFFSRGNDRKRILKTHIPESIPRPSNIRWNFNSRTIIKVYKYLEPLKACMEDIRSGMNHNDINQATGILYNLENKSFVFWLKLFNEIMPHVEILYKVMQSRNITALRIGQYIACFKTAISNIRCSSYCENENATLAADAKEVCDNISSDMEHRYTATDHIYAAKLFEKDNFSSFKKEPPSRIVDVVVETYPFFVKEDLLSQLQVFYGKPELHEYSRLSDLLKYFLENNVNEALPIVTKLVQLLLTIPMSTAEPERCFSTLNRIKNFKRSTMVPDRLNALATASIESRLLNRNPEIKKKVIDRFAKLKNRRMDFILKDV